jgi:hypothetical protein
LDLSIQNNELTYWMYKFIFDFLGSRINNVFEIFQSDIPIDLSLRLFQPRLLYGGKSNIYKFLKET